MNKKIKTILIIATATFVVASLTTSLLHMKPKKIQQKEIIKLENKETTPKKAVVLPSLKPAVVEKTKNQFIINQNGAYVRDIPELDANVVSYYGVNHAVEIIDKQIGEYFQLKDKVGFIHKDNLGDEKVEVIKKEIKVSETNDTSVTTKSVDKTEINTNQDDLYWLSRVVMNEMGSSWVSDEIQKMVASIVINRVNSPLFPNSIQEVIFQQGQYAGANYLSNIVPSDKVIRNCEWVLNNGSILPSNVLYQANFPQGSGTHSTYYDEYIGSTTYFCYQ